MSDTHRSYEIVIYPEPAEAALLDKFVTDWNKEQRKYYKSLRANKDLDLNAYKRNFIQSTGLSGRHFNSIRDDLKGKIDASFEHMHMQEDDIHERLQKHARTVKNLGKLVSPTRKDAQRLFNARRKIHTMSNRLAEIKHALAEKDPGLCFGSKRLFRAQFNTACKSKYPQRKFEDHKAWKEAWQASRKATFIMIGSKGESAGNLNCQLQLDKNNPDAMTGMLQINTGQQKLKVRVELKYGAQFIKTALLQNYALTYRFNFDQSLNRWRVHASTDVSKQHPAIASLKSTGVIGVDINEAHLAVVEVDRNGNPLERVRIDLNLYGKSTEQGKAIIGDGIKQLINYAASKEKPLVIENLSFEKKKLNLKSSDSAKYKRMLSSFSYSRIINTIKARAADRGVEIRQINPAFTSQIGAVKYQDRLALSSHHAAALVIARRGMGFIEKPLNVTRVHTTYTVPARNQFKSQNAYWKAAASKRRAHVVQYSKANTQKVDDSIFGVGFPSRASTRENTGILVSLQA